MSKTPFYSGKVKQRIAGLFMLLGAIIAIDSLIVIMFMTRWKDSPVLDIFNYYIVGIALTITWGALCFPLRGKDRIACIIKVAHCLLVFVAGKDNLSIHWLLILLFGLPVYILLLRSKSLTPIRIPVTMLLSINLLYLISPLVGISTGINFGEMVVYIIHAIDTGAGVLIILNFRDWMHDKERTLQESH